MELDILRYLLGTPGRDRVEERADIKEIEDAITVEIRDWVLRAHCTQEETDIEEIQ
jgi:hypothetical protein